MTDPSSFPSNSDPINIDDNDATELPNSELLTRPELLKRRAIRARQLARIYRDHYWALMEEMRSKQRTYYWEYGKNPFEQDVDQEDLRNVTNNNNARFGVIRCGVRCCRAKPMALTKFCHNHILADPDQKLYVACKFPVTSSSSGPILCKKPTLRSAVPSYCTTHFQKAEYLLGRALKRYGHKVDSTRKLAPKFHIIVAEYVHQIQNKRRVARKANKRRVAQKANLKKC